MVYPALDVETPVAPGGVLEKIIQEGNMIAEPSQGMYAKQMLGQLATQILDEGMVTAPDAGVVAAINDRVAEIDRQLTDQLNAIMHDEAFQNLESRWRGLSDFVFGTETSTRLKIRVLNVSQGELLKDLESAVDYDQSVLFKKVYEDEYGTLGGFPYSALIGDFYFGRHPQDVALCRRISEVASAAHAPFIASSSPKLFDMKSWTELAVPRDLSKIFESAEVIPWRSFRESVDILFQGEVEQREFADWQMGFLSLDGADVSELLGYSDFLSREDNAKEFLENLSRGKRLALMFRSME